MEPWQINVEIQATPEMAERLRELVEADENGGFEPLLDALDEALKVHRAEGKPGRALVWLTGELPQGTVYEKTGASVFNLKEGNR